MSLRYATVSLPLLAACASWSGGPRLAPDESGLVGAWIAPAAPGSPDSAVLQFGADGRAASLRIKAASADTTPWGPYRAYTGSPAGRLLCFAFRRSRSVPACRHYQVTMGVDSAGQTYRRLELGPWVTDNDSAVEVWRERSAP